MYYRDVQTLSRYYYDKGYKLLSRLVDILGPLYQKCPASCSHHCSKEGGLYIHILNVVYNVERFYKENFFSFTLEDALLAGWLHDIGKCGIIDFSNPANPSIKEPYYMYDSTQNKYKRNTRLPDHVELGQFNLIKLCLYYNIDLSFDVWLAITYHSGAYNTNLKWPISGRETDLMIFIHYCDNLASRMELRNQS